MYKEQLVLDRVGNLPFNRRKAGRWKRTLLQLLGFLSLLLQSALHYFLAHVAKKKSREFSIQFTVLESPTTQSAVPSTCSMNPRAELIRFVGSTLIS